MSCCETSKTVKAVVVSDNRAEAGLASEHGFALWITYDGKTLLFDTGQGTTIESNAAKLGIDLCRADILVLSHGHYDHTGGLPLISALAPQAALFAHPAATSARYSVSRGIARPIAMPSSAQAAIKAHPAGVQWVTESMRLTNRMGLTGPIPRVTDYEDTGGPFFVDEAGHIPDMIEDDLALWLNTDQGLVVIVGCSHAGVVNTVRYAFEQSGASKLHAVLGGFHLVAASEARLDHTLDELLAFSPDVVIPCHCTGEHAIDRIKQAFGPRAVSGAAGATFSFPYVV